MTSLKAMPRAQVAEKVKGYMASHPDEQADMTNIRQPVVDIKDRCGAPSPKSVLPSNATRSGVTGSIPMSDPDARLGQ